MKLGIDIGSVTAKVVVIDKADNIIESRYVRTRGQPVETTLSILEEILARYSPEKFKLASVTGTGGRLIAELLGLPFVNEIIAQAAGVLRFHPQVKTIIEIGGEDSKLIVLGSDSSGQSQKVADFSMNGVCAAGTGSFIDQQASRMGIPIEQFGDVAMQSEVPARVAGRCSVFAKSDMIHLQQMGTPIPDVVAGLCFAMVRNFKGNVLRGRELARPVAFQGGVAANKGIRRAVLSVLEIPESELIIPEHFAVLGAFGAVLAVAERSKGKTENREAILPQDSLERLRKYIAKREYTFASLPQLKGDNYPIRIEPVKLDGKKNIEAYVGVDIGSISTNVIVIDKDNNVLSRRYIMTAGRPIEAVKQGLYEVYKEVGDKVIIKGAGSTGSGRYMTGEFFGADVNRNEITSHARAASFVCPEVDTIFEIGGQDAKYISLQDGAIIDFAMNKVCAAGTGSFLEEQAEKLGIKIDQEFGALALSSKQPLDLGERCTVFMESQLNFHKQKGAGKENLVSGLAYSVVKNYLNKVVEEHHIGNHILFQGGVAFNRGVKAAFESVVGKKITVPPHFDCLGAIGVAMLAKEEMQTSGRQTRFRGFDLRNRKYELSSFECHDCSNLCEIHKVSFEGEKPLFYGSRCGKYDSPEKKAQRASSHIPRLFDERSKALMETYSKESPDVPNGKTVGIPRALFFHELFPLWKAFFTELGFQIVTSSPTNQHIVRNGVENVIEEPCLPIKVAHGHVLDLLDKHPDFIFLPVQCTMEKLSDDFKKSWNCPLTQSLSFIINSSKRVKDGLSGSDKKPVVLKPVVHADRGRLYMATVLKRVAKQAGVSKSEIIDKAIQTGFEALDSFNAWQQERGQEILSGLKPNERAIVVVGRVYNTCDPGMTLNLPEKLRDLGVLAIPVDFLPLKSLAPELVKTHPNMYWKAGQKILCAAELIARDPRLFGLYLTNFACGPDSYLVKFFGKEIEGKPFLTIEIDEHSADAGVITRCEAFIDTIRNAKTRGTSKNLEVFGISSNHTSSRRIYIPYMIDHGFLVAAAARCYGVDAVAVPASDENTLELGRKYTSGKECLPSTITTGDIIKQTLRSDFDPTKAAFLMPTASGPCRFGQYNKLHRLILDDVGLQEVPILLFDQTKNFYQHLAALGRGFKLRAWRGATVLDYMHKMTLERRPYEVNKGDCDSTYKELLEELIMAVGEEEDRLEPFARKARNAFTAVKIDKNTRKPRIGIVGEIFVRSNQFANGFVVRRLEELGAECALPPMEEWLDYIDHQRRRRSWMRIEGTRGDWVKQKISQFVQERNAAPLRKQFDGAIECFEREEDTRKILNRGRAYLSPAVEGEAVLSMGRVVEYAEHGFDGIVNIIPFGCMPGTIVSMLLHQFRNDYGLPIFTLAVDGSQDPGRDIRLEAFYYQASEHMHRNGRKR